VALENIARRQRYPCANRQSGCLDLFSIEHIAEHQAVCTYGTMKCPLNKAGTKCPWKGIKSNLEKHAKAAHEGAFDTSPIIESNLLTDAQAIRFCFGEIFLHRKVVRDGKFYCAVQLIGPSSQASNYKCEFKLQVANNIEQISKTFTVRSYEEDFETSFDSGKCFRLDDVVVKNFVVDGKLNFTVTLAKV
jgi:hypothetical protein